MLILHSSWEKVQGTTDNDFRFPEQMCKFRDSNPLYEIAQNETGYGLFCRENLNRLVLTEANI